jgi:protein TonB
VNKATTLFGLVCGFVMVLMVVGEAHAQSVRDWQIAVITKLRETQSYPRSALARQLEGTAQIRLTIDREGNINNYEIVKTTGHDVFDRQLDRLVERLDPLPPPPEALPDERLTFTLPVAWRLG